MNSEQTTISNLELRYMTRERRRETYIALEEFDFYWDVTEVKEFRKLWNSGKSLEEISKHFDRDIDELAILVIDQSRRGWINRRKKGIKRNV